MSTVKEIAEAIGKLSPEEVEELREIIETEGGPLSIIDDTAVTPEILEAIEEAEKDRREGNTDAFTSLDDLMVELRAAE